MSKPVALIDQDCTIADLYPLLVERLNKRYGLQLKIKDYLKYFGDHTITDYGNKLGITRNRVDKVFSTGRFFRDLKPISGARQGLKRLAKKYDLYILTRPYQAARYPYKDKYEWLIEYFPELADKIIATGSKYLVRGDLLVDDHMPFVRKWIKYWPKGKTASLLYPWTDLDLVDIVALKWKSLADKVLKEK